MECWKAVIRGMSLCRFNTIVHQRGIRDRMSSPINSRFLSSRCNNNSNSTNHSSINNSNINPNNNTNLNKTTNLTSSPINPLKTQAI